MHYIQELVAQHHNGKTAGIYSCCSANIFVLRAAIQRAIEHNTPVLIEATANQVNQFGGYTGMQPHNFYDWVSKLAADMGLPKEHLILGGDHLGPLTWSNCKEAEAMSLAKDLVCAYVTAGFTKIHLDTSMRLADDDKDGRFSDEIIARRGAELCSAAEAAFQKLLQANPNVMAPIYVIGSEVPIPGGAQEAEDSLTVTSKESCLKTLNTFKKVFCDYGLQDAWKRVVGLVVQPGVEFGDTDVFLYNRENAKNLLSILKEQPHLCFEGHSTDYQTSEALKEMVEDGICILKVGPALTFGLREALFSLELIECELIADKSQRSNFRNILEQEMIENPGNWIKYYHGNEQQQKFARAFSMSDRARYYMNGQKIQQSIQRLFENLNNINIPQTIISQYMPVQYRRVQNGKILPTADALVIDHIGDYIDDYLYAIGV